MAKKKNDGFDADGFIESVRASSVPTYHTAADSQAPNAPPIKEDIAPAPKRMTILPLNGRQDILNST